MRPPSLRALGETCRRFALVLFLAASARGAVAQLVAPGDKIYVLRTGRFDIYYPLELAREADRLSSFADETYASLALRFPEGAASSRRIPILLADGYSSPNGSFSSYPSDRIVLLVAPTRLFSDLGSYDDDLRDIFTHELTHAISLRTKNPSWAFLAGLLGDLVEPADLTATRSIIEGAAVASEGKGNSGRARDPLARSLVAQDILEGKFKDFWQAAGAWDEYPFGRAAYLYGGLFSAWLIEKGGDEAYAAFWHNLGRGNFLAGIEGGLFMKGAFEAAYGQSLSATWDEFREAMTIREGVVMATRRLVPTPGYITALAAGSSGLYWADASAGAVLALATDGSREPRRIFEADGYVSRLDLSPDGGRILVSWARVSGGKQEPVAVIRDAITGKGAGAEIKGLCDAAFAGDALVGISSEGYRTDLVLERSGERKVLLAGGPSRSYANPSSLDGATIYCIAKEGGRTLLVRVDAATSRASVLVPSLPLDRIRSLSLSPAKDGGARIALSFAPEGSLYRLAIVEDPPLGAGDGEARLFRQETLLSGSVLMPSQGPEGICYLGRFAGGEYPCAYPDDNPALALREASASWAELNPSFGKPDEAPIAAATARSAAPALPLALRTLRYPSLSSDLDSAGLVVIGSDIAERLAWSIDARYDWAAQGADLSLYLGFGLEPFSLALTVSDGFSAGDSGETRESSAKLELARSWNLQPARREIELGIVAAAAAFAPAQAGSAYEGAYDSAAAAARASLRYSSYRSSYFAPFGKTGAGGDLSFDAEWPLAPAASPRPALSIEAGADAALAPLGFALSARAAFSPDGSVAFGPTERTPVGSSSSVLSPRYDSYLEYASLPSRGDFFAFGEASITPISAEIQERLTLGRILAPLYLNRIALSGGLRGAAYGADLVDLASASSGGGPELLSSIFGRMTLTGTPLVGMASCVQLTAGAEVSWAFDARLAAKGLRIAFLAGASL